MKRAWQSSDGKETLCWWRVTYLAPASYGRPEMTKVAKVIGRLGDERDAQRTFYQTRSGANRIMKIERL
jgi:hypothetical protein